MGQEKRIVKPIALTELNNHVLGWAWARADFNITELNDIVVGLRDSILHCVEERYSILEELDLGLDTIWCRLLVLIVVKCHVNVNGISRVVNDSLLHSSSWIY